MFARAQDSLPNKTVARVALITSGVAAGSSLAWLGDKWYSQYRQEPFHFFNDDHEWLQMDKMGHSFTAYTLSRSSAALWRLNGTPEKRSVWLGAASGLAYLTMIEVLDGFSSGWGFSAGDMTANVFGTAAFTAQQLVWHEQRVAIKFSSHYNDYGNPVLNERADVLFGTGLFERTLKDYNAQTYWYSVNLHSFLPAVRPGWLNIAIGYSAGGLFDADGNFWFDKANAPTDLRAAVPRYRRFFISPDIDFTRIRTRSRFIRTALFVLNAFKMPAPALELSQGKLRYHWLFF